MDFENLDINKYLQRNSSRHHYIPRFLIEGFTNDNGLFYVFDKKKDKILKNLRSPKSVFFERDRNTIRLSHDKQSSIIEDFQYSKMDTELSKAVNYFQNEELNMLEHTNDNTALLHFFLITLFWRIPGTDFAAEDLINRAEIRSNGIDPEELRNDLVFQKLQRSGLFIHTIDEIMKSGKKGKKIVSIHEMPQDLFAIGDNPQLFRKTPSKFSELGDADYMIALSSRRIYSSTEESIENLPPLNAYKYNAAIINQSMKYVCCSDLEVLQKSVQLYTEFCKNGINFRLAEITFETSI